MNKVSMYLGARSRQSDDEVVQRLGALTLPFDHANDLDPLLARIGDARLVLLGEASHGTSEFYLARARLTQRLIAERGFRFVAVEGDWPDCARVNRYVTGLDQADSAASVLHAFNRWPTWLWANWETVAFVEWLRRHNARLPAGAGAGFYGLDVYSLWDSLAAVRDYLEQVDPDAAAVAWRALRCFEPFGENVEQYAAAAALVPASCEAEVLDLLTDLRRNARVYAADDPAAYFDAEQNALIARDAEAYYRAMLRGGTAAWNQRDLHMAATLDRLLEHYGADAKGIVWAHNTHIGDARATDWAGTGLLTIGQIARQRHGHTEAVLVGYSSWRGEVVAAAGWGQPLQQMTMPPALEGTWEDLLHRTKQGNQLLVFDGRDAGLAHPRSQRGVGVVYQPAVEASRNYVSTILPDRYDALIHLDETRALHPLPLSPISSGEPPESYPWGL